MASAAAPAPPRRLSTPSPPLPPGVQPTRAKWLQPSYSDSSHAPDSATSATPQTEPSTQRHVVYWMQRSVRTEFNHALEVAIHHANHLRLPLLVVFCFLKTYPGANVRAT